MILDELVYDAATATGSMVVNMVEGAFSFISGEIAKTGPDAMTLETPVVTMGIRGTTVAGKAAVEGNENSFTLLQDADGGVGQIAVSNDGGTQVLAQVGATTSISSFTAPPPRIRIGFLEAIPPPIIFLGFLPLIPLLPGIFLSIFVGLKPNALNHPCHNYRNNLDAPKT